MDENKPVTHKQLNKELERFATKKELRKELEKFATKEDLKRFATKADLKGFATKEDLSGLELRIQTQFEAQSKEMDAKLLNLRGDIVGKLDFLVEKVAGNRLDALETGVSVLEQQQAK